MEIRKAQQVEVLVGYTCDVCSQSCAKEQGDDPMLTTEYATLSAQWGYWSNDKDLSWHECHLCESCFDKVKQFIERQLKGTVRTGSIIE